MSTATYLRHGRGRSLNAESAMASGRVPASYVAKAIGHGATAAFVTAHAPHSGEWHHVGKFAAEVKFFDLDECVEWAESEEGTAAIAAYKADAKAAKIAAPSLADVEIDEWERVSINRFGKLAWRKSEAILKAVAVRDCGTMWEIAGYGRKAKKNARVVILDAATLRARKAAVTAAKAKATRAKNAAEKVKLANVPAFRIALADAFARAAVLALPQYAVRNIGDSPMGILQVFSVRWRILGRAAMHPAPECVMDAKHATGLTWGQIEAIAA